MPLYVYINTHTHVQTCCERVYTNKQTNMYTYIHTYIHTCVRVYISTHLCLCLCKICAVIEYHPSLFLPVHSAFFHWLISFSVFARSGCLSVSLSLSFSVGFSFLSSGGELMPRPLSDQLRVALCLSVCLSLSLSRSLSLCVSSVWACPTMRLEVTGPVTLPRHCHLMPKTCSLHLRLPEEGHDAICAAASSVT